MPTDTSVIPGQIIYYTVAATIPSGSSFSQIDIIDMLPPELSVSGTLPAGITQSPTDPNELTISFVSPPVGTVSKTFAVQLAPTTTATQICNSLLSANGVGMVAGGTQGLILTGSVCHSVGTSAPAYSVTKSSTQNDQTILEFVPFVYEISVENTGSVPLQNVQVTDPIPAEWTFVSATGATATQLAGGALQLDFGVLNASQTETAYITVQGNAQTNTTKCNRGSNLTHSAQYNGLTVNPTSSTGDVCVTILDNDPGNISSFIEIIKAANYANGANISGNPQIEYQIIVSNTSPTIGFDNVVINDLLPAGMTYVSSPTAGVSASMIAGQQNVSYTLANLPANSSETIIFVAQLPIMNAGVTISNQASVTADYLGNSTNEILSNTHTVNGQGAAATTPSAGSSSGSGFSPGSGNFSNGGGGSASIFDPNAGNPTPAPTQLQEVAASSNIMPDFDPSKPLCVPQICPACMKIEKMNIKKEVYDHAPAVDAWTDRSAVAFGQKVHYRTELEMKLSNAQNYELTGGEIYFYDVTEPMTSAGFNGVYGRQVFTNGLEWRKVSGSANQYRVNLNEIVQDGKTGTDVINDGQTLFIPMEYTMQSDLVPTMDYGIGIGNVAFAVAVLEYTDLDGDVLYFHVEEFGDNILDPDQCQNKIEDQLVASLVNPASDSFASMGAEASVNIFRPIVASRNGGAITVKTSSEGERLFSTEIPDRKIHLDYVDQVVYSNDEENFEAEEANLEEIQAALASNADQFASLQSSAVVTTDLASFFPNESAAGQFSKVAGQNIYFFTGEELILEGTYALNQSITIIIPAGDVVVSSDSEFPVALPAFVLRNGDIYVEKNVRNIDGVFVIEPGIGLGEIRSYDSLGIDDASPYQLIWNGLLLGGNPEHLFLNRIYLGENPFGDAETGGGIEASIEFVLDPRLLETEPVGFSQILGADWQQKIQ